ncbi:MAG: sugar ABC transporter permease [Spirochaetaceae bacterium]|jgi:multiple sugar transport system permease protein|nr:sugar ABC transporter permease [Spirochaetaceae bacterium]
MIERKKGKKGLHKNETLIAFGFLAPATVLFFLFVLVPIVWVMVLSFLKYDVLTPARFIGLRNWRRLGNDPRLWLTLKNTVKFVGLIVPMHVIIGIVLALGVNYIKNKIGIYIYRTLFYFPTLVTSASVIIAWRYMLSTDTGMINYYLGLLGIPAIPWLSSSFWVYPSTMLFSLWKFHGTIFLYLFIGLQAIDHGLIEAALIDGANAWQRFWHITIPMISPTLFFVIIVNLINCFQIFDEPFLLTKSGPGDASRTISVYIYETAYGSQNYGYASVAALVLLVIIMVVTLIQMKGSNMWVTYDRE